MTEPNTLQQILGYTEDGDTAHYADAHMLRRLAQSSIANDRGFSFKTLAEATGSNRTSIMQYFRGQPVGQWSPLANRIEDFWERQEYAEDQIEQALERLSIEHDQVAPPVEWGYIDEATTKELMRHDNHKRRAARA